MENDNILYYLDNNEFKELGYVKLPYSYTKTLDETLDSCKVIVVCKNEENYNTLLKVGTICRLNGIHWYCHSDKTTQRPKFLENGILKENIIEHEIQLDELTQILNDRYLGNCTFAPNRYNLYECLERLLILSNSTDIKINYQKGNIELDELENGTLEVGSYELDRKYNIGQFNRNIIKIYSFSAEEQSRYDINKYYIDLNFKEWLMQKSVDGGITYLDEAISTNPINYEKISYEILDYDYAEYIADGTVGIYKKQDGLYIELSENVIDTTYSNYTRNVTIKNVYRNPETSLNVYDVDYTQKTKYFRFNDSNLFNALCKVCKSIDKFPRLKYDNGLVLSFDYIGAKKEDVTSFSEIEDIEIIRQETRDGNASKVISNCKNLCSNEYIWFPNEMYGKSLRPQDNGTSLTANDYGELILNSNIKNVKRVRIFPKITLSIIKSDGSTTKKHLYYDEKFIPDFISATSDMSSIIQEEFATYVGDYGIGYVEVGENGYGYYVERHIKKTSSGAGLETTTQNINFFVKEKKQYDLMAHKYLFDDYRLDEKEETIYWEQGNNYFRGFDKERYTNEGDAFIFNNIATNEKVTIHYNFSKANVKIAVEYQPQIDTKIIKSNKNSNGIIKQFNQSDTMLDLDAVQRDLKNYIDEMESKDVIVNAYYDDANDIKDVGEILYDNINDIKYIITNESISYYGNGNYEVIYQLNENYVRRSEYISASSDIRDYNIPNNNIIHRDINFVDNININYYNNDKTSYCSSSSATSLFNIDKVSVGDYYGFAINSKNYNLYFKTTYKNGITSYFSLNTVLLRSSETNTISICANIDDNAIIDYDKLSGGYTADGILDTIFSLNWNNILTYEDNQFIYTPIRYTDIDGEIETIEALLVNDGDILYDDYKDSTNKLRLIYENYPSLSSDYFEYLKTKTNRINLGNILCLKDKYETMSINYQVEYKGNNGIETLKLLSDDLQTRNGVGVIYLYSKEYYSYIDKDTKLNQSYAIAKTIDSVNVIGNKIIITPSSTLNLNDYIAVIYGKKGNPMLALNNLELVDGKIELYFNKSKVD